MSGSLKNARVGESEPIVHLMVPKPEQPDAWRIVCGLSLRAESAARVREFDGPEPVTCEGCRRRHLHIPMGFSEATA